MNRLGSTNSILANNTSILNANTSLNKSNSGGSTSSVAFGTGNEEASTSSSVTKKTTTTTYGGHRNSSMNNKNGGHHHHHHSHGHHHHHHHSFGNRQQQSFSNNENANPAGQHHQEDNSKQRSFSRRISGHQKPQKSSSDRFGTSSEFSSDLATGETSCGAGSAESSSKTADEERIKMSKVDLRDDDFYDEDDYVLNEKVLSQVERLLYCTNPYSNEPPSSAYEHAFVHSHSLPQLPVYSHAPSFKSDLRLGPGEEHAGFQVSESEAHEVEFTLGGAGSSSDLTKTNKESTSQRKTIGMFNDFKLNPFHHQNMETFGRFIRQSLNLKNELANDIISNPRIQYWVDRNRSHGFVYQTYPRIDETKKRVPSVRCELCKFYGHLSHTCSIREFAFKLNNVVLRNGATRCHICGQLGHPAEAGLCPYITCSFCSQNGHWNYMCPHKDKTSRTLCHKCQRYGHNTERCPDQWRQFDRISTFEQTPQRDPSETNKPVYCYQCAQKGHYGYNCPEFYRKYFIRDYHHLDTYPIYFFAASSPFVKHSIKLGESDKRLVSYLVDLPIDGSFRPDTVDKDALAELESAQSALKEAATDVSLLEETHLNIPLKEYIRKWSNWVIDFHWTFTLKYLIESLSTRKLHFFIKNYPSLDNFILNWMWWSYSLNKDLERFTKDPFRAIGSKAWLCNDVASDTFDEQVRSESRRVKSQSMHSSSSKSSLASPGHASASRTRPDLPIFSQQDCGGGKVQRYADHTFTMTNQQQLAYLQQQQQPAVFITYQPMQQYKTSYLMSSSTCPPPSQHSQIMQQQQQQAFFYHTNQLAAHNMMMNMNVASITQMKPPSPASLQQQRLVQSSNAAYYSQQQYKPAYSQPLQQQQYGVKGNSTGGYKRDRRNSASSKVVAEKFIIDAEGNLIKDESAGAGAGGGGFFKPGSSGQFRSRFAPTQGRQQLDHTGSSSRKFRNFERSSRDLRHLGKGEEKLVPSLVVQQAKELSPIKFGRPELPGDQVTQTEEVRNEAKPERTNRQRSKSLSSPHVVSEVLRPAPISRSASQQLLNNQTTMVKKDLSFLTTTTSVSTLKTSASTAEVVETEDLDKTIVYFDLATAEEEEEPESQQAAIEIVVDTCGDEPTPEAGQQAEPSSPGVAPEPGEQLKVSVDCEFQDPAATYSPKAPVPSPVQGVTTPSTLETEAQLKRVLEEELHIKLPSVSPDVASHSPEPSPSSPVDTCPAAPVEIMSSEQNVFDKFFKSFSQPELSSNNNNNNMSNILDLLKRSTQKPPESTCSISYEESFTKTSSQEPENIIKLLLKIDSSAQPGGAEDSSLEKMDESILRCHKKSPDLEPTTSASSCLVVDTNKPSMSSALMALCSSSSSSASSSGVSISPSSPLFSPTASASSYSLSSSMTSNESITIKQILQHQTVAPPAGGTGSLSSSLSSRSSLSSASVSTSSLSSVTVESKQQRNIIIDMLVVNDCPSRIVEEPAHLDTLTSVNLDTLFRKATASPAEKSLVTVTLPAPEHLERPKQHGRPRSSHHHKYHHQKKRTSQLSDRGGFHGNASSSSGNQSLNDLHPKASREGGAGMTKSASSGVQLFTSSHLAADDEGRNEAAKRNMGRRTGHRSDFFYDHNSSERHRHRHHHHHHHHHQSYLNPKSQQRSSKSAQKYTTPDPPDQHLSKTTSEDRPQVKHQSAKAQTAAWDNRSSVLPKNRDSSEQLTFAKRSDSPPPAFPADHAAKKKSQKKQQTKFF